MRIHASLLVACVLGFTVAGVASAAKPVMTTIQVDETVPAVVDCGAFVVSDHVTGTIRVREFFEDGLVVRVLTNFALKHTLTNTTTGKSITSPDVGVDRLTIHPDGSATVAVVGIVTRVVVPGQGLIAGAIGRLVLFFDAAGGPPEVLAEAGHQGEDVDAAICAALA